MSGWNPWLQYAIAVIVALVVALAVIVVTSLVVRVVSRRRPAALGLLTSARAPFRALVVVALLWIASAVSVLATFDGWPLVSHALLIAVIVLASWLVGSLASFGLSQAAGRYRVDVADNRVARRVRTQIQMVRRLVLVVVVIVGASAVLMTFPEVRTVGASLLASAGVVSIIAGLAAQSTLGNVFAGVQLAFSDAIRVDDVVIVEGEWGLIEEITLTYVVVKIWDDRRLVVPSTYFTTTPFQNWTRRTSDLLGAIELDLDWRIEPRAMRLELDAILERSDLWDGRVKVLQVTDAVGGFVRVRVLVSARDAPTLFDLRCEVREDLVEWVHRHGADGIPKTRVVMGEDAPPPQVRTPEDTSTGAHRGLFSGSPEAEERGLEFTQSIQVIESDDEPRH
ncbi:mechanosensitive ion channel-like protein [Labedella gwakjiensis]|uniref:Mechanosensitive ion channel n=1 Tax=Labedella gwakjiensis TaxID=390269 RepID=A0A2P8GZD9_9MICO|nr:mechanosensitive ion channel domain-containing protein [Labedella gwakjiensis]PSL39334.1 mechanosensitive ion channel-like protein [Labedella gwakjiensis]RUQ86248.1 mechanosensitive ion channel [Labedella gwakjiensis]